MHRCGTLVQRNVFQLCAKIGFLPQIFTLALFPSQSLYLTSCQRERGRISCSAKALEYFTNSQCEDLSSGFIKQTDVLTPEKIHWSHPRCPQFVSAFTAVLKEVGLPELCNIIYLLSFGLHSYTRLMAIDTRFKRSLKHVMKEVSLQNTSVWWKDSFYLSEKLADVEGRTFTISAFLGPSSPKTLRRGTPMHYL